MGSSGDLPTKYDCKVPEYCRLFAVEGDRRVVRA